MIITRLATVTDPPAPGPARPTMVDLSLDDQVQSALNLRLVLKTPAQMPALQALITASMPTIAEALSSLNYVHFARFLPAPDGSVLWVITTYDGDLDPYIRDFAAVLGEVFTKALDFVKDAPRLPVREHQPAFIDFVKKNSLPAGDWSAYPLQTVIDIKREFGAL